MLLHPAQSFVILLEVFFLYGLFRALLILHFTQVKDSELKILFWLFLFQGAIEQSHLFHA